MQNKVLVQRRATAQRGMTLLELMISLTVLTVGLLGLMALLMNAVAGNGRNKNDTSGTLVSQMFMESIMNQPGSGTVTVTDCAGTSFTVATAAPATVGTSNGAALKGDGSGIDFTQAASGVATGYKASYRTCGNNGQYFTYDVRWNVRRVDAVSKMVTVAAQTGAGRGGMYFTPPVSLRTIVTN